MSGMSKKNANHKKPDARKISRKLTLKQRRFVSEFTDPEGEGFGNQTRAAELAGYSKLASAQAGHRLMRNGEIEGEVERIKSTELNHILDAAGVTIERLAKGLKQALGAKEKKAFIHQKTGNVVYSKPLIANDTRLRAIRLAAEMRGDMATKEINFNVSVLAERLQAARRREDERTVQGVRVEEGENNTQEAAQLSEAPQAEEKTKEVKTSE